MKHVVLLDGKEQGSYVAGIIKGTLIFSPDSQRLAYQAADKGKVVAVVDGQEGKHYDSFAKGGLHFSPDSRRVAYVVADAEKKNPFVVVDERIGAIHSVCPLASGGRPEVLFAGRPRGTAPHGILPTESAKRHARRNRDSWSTICGRSGHRRRCSRKNFPFPRPGSAISLFRRDGAG